MERWAATDADDDDDGDDGPGDDDGDDGPPGDDGPSCELKAPDADPYQEMQEPLPEAEAEDPKSHASNASETDLVCPAPELVCPAPVPDHSLAATEKPSPVASNMPDPPPSTTALEPISEQATATAQQDLSSQPSPAQPTKPAFTKRLSVEDLSAKRARIRELSNRGMIDPVYLYIATFYNHFHISSAFLQKSLFLRKLLAEKKMAKQSHARASAPLVQLPPTGHLP